MPQGRRWAARVLRGVLGRRGDDFWSRYADRLPDRPLRTVVVVADDDPEAPVAAYLDPPTAERLIVLSPAVHDAWGLARHGAEHQQAADTAEAVAALRLRSDVDVIVDVARRPQDELDLWWQQLWLHLRPGGLYVIDRSRSAGSALPPALQSYADTVDLSPQELLDRGLGERPRRRALARLTADERHVVMTMRSRLVLKTRDRHADEVLAEREPELAVDVLATLPAGTLTHRATVHSHESGVPIGELETELPHPVLSLRHYRGRISMASNALLVVGESALPDSFRHHAAANPVNPRLVDVNLELGRPRPRDRPERTLEGTYFHLDSENSGHYGHLLTEVISRLWGWERAKAQFPDLKAVFRVRGPESPEPVLEQRVLGAFGIDRADLVWVDEPVWLESVVAATPMWHNAIPHHVHPDLAQVWARIRDSLLAEASAPVEGFERSGGTHLFVSRRDLTSNRTCRNSRAVEAFFAERGYDVVYPEDHDLAVQAAIFDRAEVIAGFGGSAMFNVMYSHGYRAVVLLNHEAYTARNEHLFTALLGGEVHYFWSTPDVPHPEGRWSPEAYYSPWEFDFARNAADLDQVLTSLL